MYILNGKIFVKITEIFKALNNNKNKTNYRNNNIKKNINNKKN